MKNNSENIYGVTKQHITKSQLDVALEELHINGYSILHDVLNDEELKNAIIKCDEIYQHQENDFGVEQLVLINEKNIARCPLAYDDFFLYRVAANDRIIELIKKILGDYFILHLQNAIINKPNEKHHQSNWHRDLPYQNFVISSPLAISVLFCVDDFTEQTGCTYVLPFSHRQEIIPSVEYIEKHQKLLIAKAGSAIVFDSMLFHKAGYNSSTIIRRGINNVYTTPIIKQQINLSTMLEERYKSDEWYSKFLGYESVTVDSVIQWRKNRLTKRKIQ